jgi:hypothetical protein
MIPLTHRKRGEWLTGMQYFRMLALEMVEGDSANELRQRTSLELETEVAVKPKRPTVDPMSTVGKRLISLRGRLPLSTAQCGLSQRIGAPYGCGFERVC